MKTLFDPEPSAAPLDEDMSTTALAPWFGSNRMLAEHVGRALDGCSWVGVVFAGGMAEVPHIKTRQLLVNDMHKAIINLAQVAADPKLGPRLYRRVRRRIFAQDDLDRARNFCLAIETLPAPLSDDLRLDWAENYFRTAWMGRSALAGTKREFTGNLSVRWKAGGGGSAVRYYSAARSLVAWRRTMQRCEFVSMDFRQFLTRCLKNDLDGNGIYCDSPFYGPGDDYKHNFTDEDHGDLASMLHQFSHSRIVCRFYESPIVAQLYPQASWKWERFAGRTQANNKAAELLISRRGKL